MDLKLLSFDPSSRRTGYAFGVLEKTLQLKEYGVIDLRKSERRLYDLFGRVVELINYYTPHKILVETPFYGINAQTVIRLGEVRGVILLACQAQGVECKSFTPAEIKKSITGQGRVKKGEVLAAVNQIYNLQTKDHDIADAVAILHTYSVKVKA